MEIRRTCLPLDGNALLSLKWWNHLLFRQTRPFSATEYVLMITSCQRPWALMQLPLKPQFSDGSPLLSATSGMPCEGKQEPLWLLLTRIWVTQVYAFVRT